ncbi:helix-turn-helix domain-containing protein [Euzebya tangerina]|uniref:helix-turn-helix domain-containing protein n=1 Tax=Euzebya tangerina TaxID=591198 RepID=UPI000E31A268|nr:helix-turn-helix transcriptional regulator [Euzebya tangerina]
MSDLAAVPPAPDRADDDAQESHEKPPLLRELAGQVLRQRRQQAGDRLIDIARRAGVSPQYLSEIERGVKDPSSEILSAVADALGMTLDDLLVEIGRRRGLELQDHRRHLVPVPDVDRADQDGMVSPLPAGPEVALPNRWWDEPRCQAA